MTPPYLASPEPPRRHSHEAGPAVSGRRPLCPHPASEADAAAGRQRPSKDNELLALAAFELDPGPAASAAALGTALSRADGRWVREMTGFAIGGVAPVGHLAPPLVLIDEDLMALDPVWAAAGSPRHIFRTTAPELLRLTAGMLATIRKE
jgi:Aminoacyl-tRNA editing domain